MKGIALIGMPTSGKSTVGRQLAQELSWPVYDIDSMMEEEESQRLAEVIKQKGRDYVAQLGSQMMRSLELENAILSTPGSILYNDKACHAHIKKCTQVIWLDVPLQVVQERLADDPNNEREIIGLEDGDLKKLFLERQPGYEKLADTKLDTTGKTVKGVTEEILTLI